MGLSIPDRVRAKSRYYSSPRLSRPNAVQVLSVLNSVTYSEPQAAVFAERAKQDPVQQLLGAAQDFGRGDGGILAPEAGQDAI